MNSYQILGAAMLLSVVGALFVAMARSIGWKTATKIMSGVIATTAIVHTGMKLLVVGSL